NILVIITDGEDNESHKTLEEAIRAVQGPHGPTIYAIGILGSRQQRARQALEALAAPTGGLALFPRSLDELDAAAAEIARDIRNQYSLSYTPAGPAAGESFRRVRVMVRAAGYNDLLVRTRSG